VRRTIAISMTFWLVIVALGCASERARLLAATDAYTTTLEVLADARRAGLIDDQAAAEVEQWRVVARAALDAWRLAVETGQPAEGAIQRFNEALRELTRARLSAEGRRGDEGG